MDALEGYVPGTINVNMCRMSPVQEALLVADLSQLMAEKPMHPMVCRVLRPLQRYEATCELFVPLCSHECRRKPHPALRVVTGPVVAYGGIGACSNICYLFHSLRKWSSTKNHSSSPHLEASWCAHGCPFREGKTRDTGTGEAGWYQAGNPLC